MLPSEKADISPAKAKKMLKEGQAHGKPLSPDQKKMLGSIAGKSSDGKMSRVYPDKRR